MAIKLSCPSCSKQLAVRIQFAGKDVACPNCRAPIHVPIEGREKSLEDLPSMQQNWLLIGASILLCLAVGASAGVIFGHSNGERSAQKSLSEAQAHALIIEKKLKEVEATLAATEAKRDKLNEQIDQIGRDRDQQVADAQKGMAAANERAQGAEGKLQALLKADAQAAAKRRDEEIQKADAAKQVANSRENPRVVVFKDVANFPEDYLGAPVRVDDVWLSGSLERVEKTQLFSTHVESRDGKTVLKRTSLGFGTGLVFVIPDSIGRPLALIIENDSRYGVNLNFEITRHEGLYVGRFIASKCLRLVERSRKCWKPNSG